MRGGVGGRAGAADAARLTGGGLLTAIEDAPAGSGSGAGAELPWGLTAARTLGIVDSDSCASVRGFQDDEREKGREDGS